jgi:hypothetical protein
MLRDSEFIVAGGSDISKVFCLDPINGVDHLVSYRMFRFYKKKKDFIDGICQLLQKSRQQKLQKRLKTSKE